MTDKAKAKLVGLWVIFTLTLSAIACGGSTEDLCPKACREVGLDYHDSTASTCDCLKSDGEAVVKLVTVTCTKCGEPMRLPEHVAGLPADERLCGACVKKLLKGETK